VVALYQISTNTVLQSWGNDVPNNFSIPGNVDVHCPNSSWTYGDYKFIPVTYDGIPNDAFSQSVGTSQAVSNGVLVVTTLYTELDLATVQASLCSSVDADAENVRLQYITPGSGQMGIYILKYNEAREIVANTSLGSNTSLTYSTYPLNAASIGLSGIATINDAANITITQYSAWIGLAAQVESVRLSSKASINAANSVSAAMTIYNGISW